MKVLKIGSIYSCYPLYQILLGGSPALKYYESLCIAEVCRIKNLKPHSLVELFCGEQENRAPLVAATGAEYLGVDLHKYSDNLVLDLSSKFGKHIPKTKLLVAGFRSIEATVCDPEGRITYEVLTAFLRECAVCLESGGLLWIDISGSQQEPGGSETRNCSTAQVLPLCKVFGLNVPDDGLATIEYTADVEYDPVHNNQSCTYSGTLYTQTESRDFVVESPFTFRYWMPHEVIHCARMVGLELSAIYSSPENLLISGLLYPPTDFGMANKLVFTKPT